MRIIIDSVEEVDLIERAANELDRVVRVRLRLKSVLSGFIDHSDFVAEGLVPTDIAALAYKGGLTFDQIRAIVPRILEMKNVGQSNFNAMPRPATVLVTGEQASIVRRRETEADVFSRDVMPEHLARVQVHDRGAARLLSTTTATSARNSNPTHPVRI